MWIETYPISDLLVTAQLSVVYYVEPSSQRERERERERESLKNRKDGE